MAYLYPYGDTQQLNLDWLIEQWNEVKSQIDGSLQAEIDRVEAAITDLLTARDEAVAAQTAAQASAQAAAGSASTASGAASTATAQAQAAAGSAATAGAHASDAQGYAATAQQAAQAANNSAGAAAVSEGNARNSETAAAGSSSAAAGNALYAEGYAKGTQNGNPVSSGSPYYENNAKYYSDQAAQDAQTAQNVLNSIPADYTQLSNDVSELQTDLISDTVITWNQLAKLANNWAPNWGSGTVISGDDEITVNNAPANYYSYNGVPIAGVVGHIYLFLCYAKANNATAGLYSAISGAPKTIITSEQNYTLLSIKDIYGVSTPFTYNLQLRAYASNNGSVAFKNPKIFDLTLMGLETISAEEFVEMFPNWDTEPMDTVGTPRNITQINNSNKNIYQTKALIAPVLNNMIADTALTANDFRIVNNTLYRITSYIASGATLIPNTNCIETTITAVLKTLLS